MSGVGFFHDDHAVVLAEFPRKLATAHVHGKNLGRAALQQAIGETAGGGAEINAPPARDVELKMFERVFELVAAAADEFFAGVEGEFIAGFD